ncbi:MAG: MATE family efflux transporter [Desulfovibrio sp.]|nr:MATE family efflux transporter [Desulfovibrio sp.]
MFRVLLSRLEARYFYSLGLPIFVAQLSQVGMNFVDTVMTGRASAEDMAAVAVAGSIWAPVSLLGLGCLFALPPLTAQCAGAGDRAGAVHILRQGLWLTFFLSLVLMALFYALSLHMDMFGLEPHLAHLAGGYLRAILWGLPGFMLFVNLRSFLEGFSRTRPAMIIGLLGLAFNVPCNYVLIYGKLGLPALGAVGCGVATSLCYWFMALAMFYYVRRDPSYRDLHPLFLPLMLPGSSPCKNRSMPCLDVPLVLRILRIGFPGALALFFEVSLFALTALLLAPLGTVAVAGHQIAMNLGTVMFMFPLALGMTATIRVGHSLGARKVMQARLTARTALSLSVCFALAIAAVTIAFRHQWVGLYNDDTQVTALAAHLLLYMACYQVVDGFQTVGLGVLRGYNDTRIIGLICFVTYWVIGLPVGYVLARTDWIVPAMGPAGFWLAYILALGFGAVCYLSRIRFLHSLDSAEIERRVRR